MTPEQKQTLHLILLDAKAEINDGRLFLPKSNTLKAYPSYGICMYVRHHKMNDSDLDNIVYTMYENSRFYKGYYVAPACDFSHPDRLALLDWLINETKP